MRVKQNSHQVSLCDTIKLGQLRKPSLLEWSSSPQPWVLPTAPVAAPWFCWGWCVAPIGWQNEWGMWQWDRLARVNTYFHWKNLKLKSIFPFLVFIVEPNFWLASVSEFADKVWLVMWCREGMLSVPGIGIFRKGKIDLLVWKPGKSQNIHMQVYWCLSLKPEE